MVLQARFELLPFFTVLEPQCAQPRGDGWLFWVSAICSFELGIRKRENPFCLLIFTLKPRLGKGECWLGRKKITCFSWALDLASVSPSSWWHYCFGRTGICLNQVSLLILTSSRSNNNILSSQVSVAGLLLLLSLCAFYIFGWVFGVILSTPPPPVLCSLYQGK